MLRRARVPKRRLGLVGSVLAGAVVAAGTSPVWASGSTGTVGSVLSIVTTTTATATTTTPTTPTTPTTLGGVSAGPALRLPLPSTTSTTPATVPSYWVVGSQGGVGAYGGTAFPGSMQGKSLAAPIVGMAPTPSGKGYWLVASDGGIFAFGDAQFHGSMGGHPLNRPIVAMAPTPSGNGYWLVASDGGIFAFGDAQFDGSMGGHPLNRPVAGMAPTHDGKGYWLVASDGGIFAFGDAVFDGSMGGHPLNRPVVGMAPTPSGDGYWLDASDGGIFAFGDAPFHGSMGGHPLSQPVVGMGTPDAGGYWEVAADGGIFAFGDAPFRGSASGHVPAGEWISSMAEGPGTGSGTAGDFASATAQSPGAQPYAHAATGYDISWPQCGSSYPPSSTVAVVGANNGAAFTANPCFASEAAWGGPNLTVYLNVNSPQGSDSSQYASGPAGNCAVGDLNCESYNYGYNTARQTIAQDESEGYGTSTWWLDVETGSYWTSDTSANDQVIAGALGAVKAANFAAAIYSTSYQWNQIAGNYNPGVPVWYPTGTSTNSPSNWCTTSSFAGGPVYLVQDAAGNYDGDYSC
ncbi:MAG: glycoside hydrolase family 25 domain-containing protein [Acidimicrobiales bacterium]